MITKIKNTLDEWRAVLPADVYSITRALGTEPPFNNAYWDNAKTGMYVCSNCQLPLFDSVHKFSSGTGWPSFWQPVKDDHVALHEDRSAGMM